MQCNVYLNRLENWCQGETLDQSRALLTVVQENKEIAEIEYTLKTKKCLGCVQVRGRMLSDTSSDVLVLCECKEIVTDASVQQQQPGEKLSEFLRRLERCLSKVVQKGGLPPSSRDKALLEQLVTTLLV